MVFKTKPTFRDASLVFLALICLLGLLGLSFVDGASRQAFLNMAPFTIGAVVGYFIPGTK
ncbi:hypothetical protein [Nostoc sp. C110]|uniref:hypothetical protein n=1 Tax=Nostoc sp. C110 TaxID=3349876 RepID=UPI00370DB693